MKRPATAPFVSCDGNASAELGGSAEQRTFLLQLSDAVRPLTDALAIKDEVTRRLGEHLGVTRVAYGEVADGGEYIDFHRNYVTGGGALLTGRFRMADYGPSLVRALEEGLTVVVPDVATSEELSPDARAAYAKLGIAAFIGVPLNDDERFVGVLNVHHAEPRAWTDGDVELVRDVAERTWAAVGRARAEAALRESEERCRALFESIDEGLCVVDVELDAAGSIANLIFRNVNRAFERQTGVTAVAGSRVEELLPRLVREHGYVFAHVLRTGEALRLEIQPASSDRWCELHFSRIGGLERKQVAIVIKDVTERRRTEERLSFQARLLANAAEPMIATDERFVVTYWNAAAEELFGWTEAEAIGRPASELFRTTFADRTVDEARAVMIRQGSFVGEVLHQKKDGTEVITDVRSRVLYGPRGEFTGTVNALRDTTARKQAEKTLRESEAKLGVLFETLPIGVTLFDANGKLVLANHQMRRYMPTARIPSVDEARYGRWRGYDETGRRIERHDYPGARALRGETVVPGVEFIFEADDGAQIWTRVAALPVRSADGKIAGAVAAVTEIDELKRTEEALRESDANARRLLDEARAARAQAEAANRSKDEFLATLSHELRTPLSAILLWAGALRSGSVPLSGLGRAVDAILQSAESQSRLIEDLLDLSRLSAGKLALSRAASDVDKLILTAIEMVRPLAIAKGLSLGTDLEGRLGRMVVDAARLRQVLWNLLTNATKFTPAGGTVTLRARRQDAQLLLEVEDTGAGIAPEFMPHLFEKFRQADMGTTRQHMGLGIGLALSKQLVELHGGRIEAESRGPGQGALFRVRLPWLEPDSSSSSGTEPLPSTPIGAPLSGVLVLVVEDDANTRAGMTWTLERAGANVVAVATAAEALSVVQGPRPPEVIVCDLGLPEVSGLELVERIAKQYDERGLKPPPSCAVSAHARDVDRQRAIAAGFDMYLAKPITPERLVEAVADLRDVLAS